MGINVKFAQTPEITSVSNNKEGNGDGAHLAVYVKVNGLVTKDKEKILSKLLGCTESQAKSFWKDTQEQEAVFVGVENITVPTRFDEGQHCNLAGKEYKGVRVRQLSFTPVGGALKLTFNVQIPEIPMNDVGLLADLIKTRAECELIADPDLLDELEK